MQDMTCSTFLQALASKAPTPGGGGAAAFTGALGAALGAMVANLTLGKQKYAAVQDDIERLEGQCRILGTEMMDLIEADAKGFQPLADAYKIPRTRENRDILLQKAQEEACQAPLAIMRKGLEGLALQQELAEKGTVMAVSDVGAGVQLFRSAILAASLNVYINTRTMKDRQAAARLKEMAELIEKDSIVLADHIYDTVRRRLQ
ncbi:sugar ABC transporter substrate-binding protein [Megasphaera sp. AM44-1BH]|uniref:cyclodeaminase/cyclohydrolase family protein n=1 Tax=Megasphaera sp. AM44-1BH TaxID=2292358 RepID=UPI000E4A370C|nr:cyclodeaminase/cyclohydrolase family protein [Megasphaera sp. AM44-1BH]RHA14025.1 sugar ABC transporter substrate-binding protein [Megasphaera sp. AM44-1BH]